MDNQSIKDAIDACRDPRDLSQPEFADLARAVESDPALAATLRRVEQVDQRLRAAMHDVPVPNDLAARLKAAVRQARNPQSGAPPAPLAETPQPNEAAQPSEPVTPATRTERSAPRHRRARWLAAALAVAACLLVGVGIYFVRTGGQPAMTLGTIQHEALAWRQKLRVEGDIWNDALAAAYRQAPPNGLSVEPVGVARVQFLDQPATAYRLRLPRSGQTAVQIVVRASRLANPSLVERLPHEPPSRYYDTQGQAVGVWRSGEFVYLLVVDDPASYGEFIRRRPKTLA